MRNKVIIGDVLEKIKEIPDNYVHCVVTSPPYYGLRDYGTAKWEGGDEKCDHIQKTNKQGNKIRPCFENTKFQYKDVCPKCGAKRIDKQIGLEQTPEEFIEKMVQVFREVKRILHPSGTLWLNFGDSYAGKSLLMIPFRVAMALQDDGWYLRSVMPWLKRNAMPESVKDRPSNALEYVFLLSKSPRYFYDNEAIRIPHITNAHNKLRDRSKEPYNKSYPGGHFSKGLRPEGHPSGRNFRNTDLFFQSWQGLWQEEDDNPLAFIVNPQGYKGAHFATYPEKLVEPCIMAGTSEKGVCPDCGEPWVRVVNYNKIMDRTRPKDSKNIDRNTKGDRWITTTETIGWKQNCKCEPKEPIPAIVFDPFLGSGTTAAVSAKLGRDWLGIELNDDYIDLIHKRISQYSTYKMF